MAETELVRRLTVGAELQPGGGAHVRVWAPACSRVDLVIPSRTKDGTPRDRADGPRARRALRRVRRGGARGRTVLVPSRRPRCVGRRGCVPIRRRAISRTGRTSRPPTSTRRRFSGPTRGRKGLHPVGQVIYELHVGTFTPEGTWRAAAAEIEELRGSGITVDRDDADRGVPGPLRLGLRRRQPLRAGAPLRHARRSARLRRSRARLGIGVILDVVYNHLGPDGNYLAEFSPDYFTDKYTNDWGRAINFEGPRAGARALRGERALLDRRVPFRRPAPRRDAGHQGRVAATRRRRHRRGARARRPAPCRSSSSPRTSRRTRSWCAIRRAAATASTRSGTTMLTTRRWWR